MKLYITAGSPYARMARMLVIEKGLQSRVSEHLAQTRVPDSPHYTISVSGRVPYLVCEDGEGLEESIAICDYLDGLVGAPLLTRPEPSQTLSVARLDGRAASLLDGLAVWFRELVRPANEPGRGPCASDRIPKTRSPRSSRESRGLPLSLSPRSSARARPR